MPKPVRPPSDRSVPPAPNEATRGLDEVERALSVLDGRHPEHHRVARETRAAAEGKREQTLAEQADDRARSRRRGIFIASASVAAIAVAVVVVGIVRRSTTTSALLTEASAPWERAGFAVVASSGLSNGARLEASVDPGCVVVLSTAPGALTVERGSGRTQGSGSVGWCACTQERVVATSDLPSGTPGGIRILRIEGGGIGGAKLFPLAALRPATIATGGEDCAESMLDEWVTSGRHPPHPFDDRSLEGDGPRAAIRNAGLHVVAAAPATAPFVIATLPAASCAIAESTVPSDRLALRANGGARVVSANGALAWCDATGATYTVWREGDGELRVLAAPSKRVGGMLGLRDAASAAGMKSLATWTRPDDRGADAADALRAAFVADVVLSPDGNAAPTGAQDKRVVSISREPDTEIVVTSPPGAYYLCSPPLDPGVTHAICIESSPHMWRPRTGAKVGLAYAPLPFWMSSFATMHEPDALSGALALVGVARRLGAAGFAPTILGGATETAKGVDILGRAGEDAIVAVGTQPKPPWLLAYTNGAPWDLSGDPRIVPLKPFEHVTLTTAPPPSAPKETRRTVVFRRTAKP